MSSILSALQQAQQQRDKDSSNQNSFHNNEALSGSEEVTLNIETLASGLETNKTPSAIKYVLALVVVGVLIGFFIDYFGGANQQVALDNKSIDSHVPSRSFSSPAGHAPEEEPDKVALNVNDRLAVNSSQWVINGLLFVADNDPLNKVVINNISLRQGSVLPSGEVVHHIGFDKVLLKDKNGQIITLIPL